MAYISQFKRITSFRIDRIVSVKLAEKTERFDELREKLNGMQKHMWGVSTQSRYYRRMEHVEFTVRYYNDEQHIHHRLRIVRNGAVQ